MDFYAEDAQHYQPTQIEPLRGRKAIREDYEKLTIIPFPDAHLEKIRSFGQGDLICVELLFKGTHTGPLVGPEDEEIPPTNKSVQVPICFVVKIKDGKIIEAREYTDQLGYLAQLGVL